MKFLIKFLSRGESLIYIYIRLIDILLLYRIIERIAKSLVRNYVIILFYSLFKAEIVSLNFKFRINIVYISI